MGLASVSSMQHKLSRPHASTPAPHHRLLAASFFVAGMTLYYAGLSNDRVSGSLDTRILRPGFTGRFKTSSLISYSKKIAKDRPVSRTNPARPKIKNKGVRV